MVAHRRIGPDGGFLREFTDVRKRVQSLETRPSGVIATREMFIVTDPETGVKTIMGKLPDGSTGFQPFVGDLVPPPVATAPTATAQPGTITVTWDGTFVGGAEQPADFEHLNVMAHKVLTGSTVLTLEAGSIRLANESVVITSDIISYGEQWQFSFESEDYNGNISARSARTPLIDVVSYVDDSLVGEALSDLAAATQTAQEAAETAQGAAQAAQDDADAAAASALAASNLADSKGKVYTRSTAPSADYSGLWIDTAHNNVPRRYLGVRNALFISGGGGASVVTRLSAKGWAVSSIASVPAFEEAVKYDLVAMDAGYAGLGTSHANLATKLYDRGVSLYTSGNDTISMPPLFTGAPNRGTPKNVIKATSNVLGISYADYADTDLNLYLTGVNSAAVVTGTTFVTSLGTDQPLNLALEHPTNFSRWVHIETYATPAAVIDTHLDWISNNWVAIQDQGVISASSAAASAQIKADQAFNNAASAATAAGNAQTSANSKNTNWYQDDQPAGTGHKVGDTWFDTNDNYKIRTWNGSIWQTTQDSWTAQQTADSKGRVYTQSIVPPVEARLPQNLWNDTSLGLDKVVVKYWSTTTNNWEPLADKAATEARVVADSKGETIYSNTEPAASQRLPQNLWIDTTGGININKRWDGSAWVVVADTRIASTATAVTAADSKAQTALDTAVSKGTVYTQNVAPPVEARLPQNLWVDTSLGLTNSVTKYWDGNAWTALADKAATDAATLAGSKSKVIYSTTAPTGADANALTLWIDTTGGANTPKKWVSGTTWTAVTDKVASDAAATAASKGEVIYSDTEPIVAKRLTQNLWVDTTGGINLHKRWTGSAWTVVADSRIATTASQVSALSSQVSAVSAQADRSITTFFGTTTPATPESGDIWLTGVAGEPMKRYNGSIWQTFEDPNVQAAYQKAGDAEAAADAKVRTFAQDAEPTGMVPNDVGDIWIDTNDKNKMYRYSGAAWVAFRDATILDAQNTATSALNVATVKTKTYMQTNQPAVTGNTVGDTWFDSDYYNKPHIWTGSAWVSAQDGTIALAQSAADSKIETYYAATAPTGLTTINTGDLWIDSDDGSVSRWTGSAWVLVNDNGAAKVAAKFSDLGIDQSWVDNIEAQSDKAITTFFGATTPVGAATGDLWLSGVAGTPMKRFSATSTWDTFEDPNVQNAYQKASDAEALADAKIKTFAATSAPTGLLATDAGDLWINTTAGSGAISRWSGTVWQLVTDNGTAAANKALTDLGINQTWVTNISNQADKAITTFYGATTPTGMAEGDLWLAGTAGTPMKRYTSGAWATFEDPNVQAAYQLASDAEALADQKVKTFAQTSAPAGLLATDAGDLWINTTAGSGKISRWSGSAWIEVTDNGAANANAVAAKKTTTWFQTAQPAVTGNTTGDVWFDTDDGNKVYVWNGTAWTSARDTGIAALVTSVDGKNTNYWQNAMPSGGTYKLGDLWIDTDDGNKMYAYNGTTFVAAQDVAITTAQQSANGKNKVHYSTSDASGTVDTTDSNRPFIEGDTWFKRSTVSPFNIIGQWEFTGGAWVSRKISGQVVTELDAGTISVGVLRGENLSATAINGKTVTGATVQTEATASRGIKLTSAELAGYDGSGNKNFSLSSAGVLTVKGNIKSGSTIEGATITGSDGLQTSGTVNTGVKMTNTGIKAYDSGNNLSFHLDATTGKLEVPGLKANSVNGDVITGKSILADKLVITSTDNLIVEADFRNSGKSWGLSANNTINATAGRGSLPAMRFTGINSFLSSLNTNNRVSVDADNKFRGSLYVKSNITLPAATCGIIIRCYTTATVFTDIDGLFNLSSVPANTWTSVSGITPDLPANTKQIEFFIWVNHTSGTTATITDIDAVSMTRASSGSLIVDGAIDGKVITGPTIQTSTGATTGIKLTPTELAGWDGTNKNFSLTSAGALTLKGAIQSGSTIEGARITGTSGLETSTVANTGVKVTNTGIKAYDGGNNLSFHLDATTGKLEVPGLKANSVDGDVISAGSLTAQQIRLGDFSNLITNGFGDLGAGIGFGSGLIYDSVDKPSGTTGAFKSTAGQGTYAPGYSFIDVDPNTEYTTEIWLKADKPNSRIYIELRDQAGGHGTANVLIPDGTSQGGYVLSNFIVPTVWTKYTVKTTTTATATRLRVGAIYFNHTNGTERTATVSMAMALRRRLGGSLIVDGAIQSEHMTVGTIDGGIIKADTLAGTTVKAQSMTTDKLVISSTDNLIVESSFEHPNTPGASWTRGTNQIMQIGGGRSGGNAMRLTGTTGINYTYNLNNKVQVNDTHRFKVAMWVKTNVAYPVDKIRVGVSPYSGTTKNANFSFFSNTSSTATAAYVPGTNVWTRIEGMSKPLPAGTTAVEFYINTTAPSATAYVDIDSIEVTRASDGLMIVDGSITADKMEAELILGTKIVAGDPDGTHAEMSPEGFKVFARNLSVTGGPPTEAVRLGVANDDDYFAITQANGKYAASISQEGIGSFSSLYTLKATTIGATSTTTSGGFYYDGRELTSILDDRPRGIIAAAYRDTFSAYNATIGGPFQPYLRLEAQLVPGRMYKIWTSAIRVNTDDGVGCTVGLQFNSTTFATVDNSNVFTQAFVQPSSTGERDSVVLQELFAIGGNSKVTYSFLLCFGIQDAASAGQAGLRGNPAHPVRLVVEDIGPSNGNIGSGVSLDGTVPPPPPKNNYVKQYACTNSMNYQTSGAQYNFDTGRMYQGLSPAGYGNLGSIAIFDRAAIQADLSGATVNYVRVYFNFQHWYYNSGGTARIGVHSHTGIPATWSNLGALSAISGGWPKPGARWVDLSSSHWEGFKNGYGGVYLEGDTSYNTYGYTERPTLEIGYNK